MVNEKQAKQVPTQAPVIPTGVKIISVLYYIGAVFGVIFGILFLVGAGAMSSIITSQIPMLAFFGSGLIILGGLLLIGMGVLYFFIARGLQRTQSWARIIVIIFACIGVLMGLISIFQGNFSIISFGLNLAIGGYLLFSQEVKQAFA